MHIEQKFQEQQQNRDQMELGQGADFHLVVVSSSSEAKGKTRVSRWGLVAAIALVGACALASGVRYRHYAMQETRNTAAKERNFNLPDLSETVRRVGRGRGHDFDDDGPSARTPPGSVRDFSFTHREDNELEGVTFQCGEVAIQSPDFPWPWNHYSACRHATEPNVVAFRDGTTTKIVRSQASNFYKGIIGDSPRCHARCEEINGTKTGPESDRCFFLPEGTKNWHEASEYCKDSTQGEGSLATIYSQAENDVMESFREQTGEYGVWLGAFSFRGYHQRFLWENGDAVAFSGFQSWAEGEPNNFGDNEYCMKMYYIPGKWNDFNCFEEQRFACVQPERIPFCGAIAYLESQGAE